MISICEDCKKEYQTYVIILDNNPFSIASFLEDTTKPDGSRRSICKECWEYRGVARIMEDQERSRLYETKEGYA